MPNLQLSTEIVDARKGIEKTFAEMFDKEFAGLAPGTRYLKDPEFIRWFESERDGVPGPPTVDPTTGQQIPGWKKPPRPNFEQVMALGDESARSDLRRYGRLTGREDAINLFIEVCRAQAKANREAMKNGVE